MGNQQSQSLSIAHMQTAADDHSVETMTHNPYAVPPGSLPPPSRDGYEEMLVGLAVRFLHDASFNPFACSVPVERLQQRLLLHSPDLFRFVVQDSLKEFLRRYPSQFVLGARPHGRTSIRSTQHINWEEGEKRQMDCRRTQDAQLCDWLRSFLIAQPNNRATVNDVVEAFNAEQSEGSSRGGAGGLARGDLVRFVVKRQQLFVYDSAEKAFSLQDGDCDSCASTPPMSPKGRSPSLGDQHPSAM